MKQEFNQKREAIVAGLDTVVIRKCISDIMGGRTLNVEGYTADIIPAGHPVIRLESGDYAPMPCHEAKEAEGETAAVAGGFDALPEGASYVGINKTTIPADAPAAAIMIDGIVNETLIPYPEDAIWADFKAACPHIIFNQDEEA